MADWVTPRRPSSKTRLLLRHKHNDLEQQYDLVILICASKNDAASPRRHVDLGGPAGQKWPVAKGTMVSLAYDEVNKILASIFSAYR